MFNTRLYQDRWLVQNTLPYILPYLEVDDVLNLSQTCELWKSVLQEYYFARTFIPTCYDHKDSLIEYGPQVERLQLMDIKFQNILKVSEEASFTSNQNSKEFLANFENLNHFSFYTSSRLIFIERRNYIINEYFYWKSLLNTKLTYLDLAFHLPATFGREVLRYLKSLEVLKLHFYSGIDEYLFESIGDLKCLYKLELLKVEVNEDMSKFLPMFSNLDELTLLIRAPCDTNYTVLLKNVAELSSSLKKFCWVVAKVTMSDAFFGLNSQNFLGLNNLVDTFDKRILIESLRRHLPYTKITVEFDYEFPLGIRKHFKKCFSCCKEAETSFVSSYDMGCGITNK
ncbi:unnamed protein product [Ceutorhynchus assimilis]|uniref:F-box domain-containing protein n=1 Tax=Ceutorhynchus assimilis TaxID=467358 RepID=A0A9P0DI95_9CUCU|nr:unnamed protein product [Ceutorhynchus assimilis]